MNEQVGTSLKTVCESFIISQASKGVSEATIKNYHSHLKGIAKHLDIEMPFETLTKRQLEQTVVSMRGAGLAHNCSTPRGKRKAASYQILLNFRDRCDTILATQSHSYDEAKDVFLLR